METLKILLVEDEPEVCRLFQQYITELDHLEIVANTGNSFKALEYINDYQPNAIILDLELHKGGGTGIDILTGINALPLLYHPFILITTNNSSRTMFEYARELGADFILSKHQDNYTELTALKFLQTMKDTILSGQSGCYIQPPGSAEESKKRMHNRLRTELNRLGFNPKHLGYNYLIDTILLKTENEKTNSTPELTAKYHKTASSIDRAMQNAINWAWAHTPIEDLLHLYTIRIRSDKGVPTTAEFVSYFINILKDEY